MVVGRGGALNSPAASKVITNYVFNATNRFALRLTNTTATISQLQRSDSAILLENALLDTAKGAPAIPAHLLAQGDPGTWIVQSRGPIDKRFRTLLQSAGATIVSYIPNNAYLVRASQAVADQLQAGPLAQAVLPYEPYYKLKPSLLRFAVAQTPLPDNSALNVLLFADTADQTSSALQKLGTEILGAPERTPFGPVVTVRSAMTPLGQSPAMEPGALLSAIAGLPGVQEIEWAQVRTAANDLSRVRIGVAVDPVVSNNYFGLTGNGVLVNVNDSGVDASHPDLAGRVFGDSAIALVDTNGHGTHVAGIIASSGGESSTVTNASGPLGPYSGTNTQFRGMAPGATLFSVPFGLTTGPFSVGNTFSWPSDARLQETPAQTNAFISNNSWNYIGGDTYPSYDLHAASYDAAVRDALPTVPGSQPLLIVFSAGNAGGGSDDGSGGNPDTILSPATAKNVITVGAIEQNRNVTNVVIDLDGNQSHAVARADGFQQPGRFVLQPRQCGGWRGRQVWPLQTRRGCTGHVRHLHSLRAVGHRRLLQPDQQYPLLPSGLEYRAKRNEQDSHLPLSSSLSMPSNGTSPWRLTPIHRSLSRVCQSM